MNTASHPAESQITKALQAGHALTVRWDCGGDESFVYTQLDGKEIRADHEDATDLASLLDQYLTDRLELPDAGEFSMEGTGRIFMKAGEVIIDYQSQAFSDDSWMEDMTDEDLADMGYTRPNPTSASAAADSDDEEPDTYTPDEGMSQQYTGRLVLFQL